jgi:hypothetical protein
MCIHMLRSVQYVKMHRIACDIACRYLDLTNISSYDCPEALIDTGVARCTGLSLALSKTAWARCKKTTLLPVCAAEPTCLSGEIGELIGGLVYSNLPEAGGDLCKINNAKPILIVLWCLFASLLAIMWSMFVALRCWQAKQVNGPVVDSDKGRQTIVSRMQHGWIQALKWKPWGLKMSALLGLGMFYFDKTSDITLLKQVLGHTWTGYVLLTLLLSPYVLQGYILIYHLTTKVIGWTVLTKLSLFTFVLAIPLGVILTIVLDVLLFFADLGNPFKYVNQRVNLEHYQVFRDAGRALFAYDFICGCWPTTAQGERGVMYFALKQEHAAWVFWQLLSARKSSRSHQLCC